MPMTIYRRDFLAGSALLAASTALPSSAWAVPEGRRHGMAAFGDLKYSADFAHFDYVNPDAPKGGTLSRSPSTWAFNQNPQTFNSFNTLVLKGDAPVGLEKIYDTLMVRALDEPDALYGLLAQWVEYLDGGNRVRFGLRAGARFHDGSTLDARDVVFTLNALKEKGHPLISQAIKELSEARAVDDLTVECIFSGKQARDLAQTIASLPIVSRQYYAAREFGESSLELPLGSGPYKVGAFKAGSHITYDRVADYWGADLPVMRGQHNFDHIRYELYRDRDVAFEAFKAGQYRLREEFTSRTWATGYDFPAINDGRVKRAELPDDTPSGAQGWFINTRRKKFADPRVREALINAFDFEWTNKTLFYGAYKRTHSFFENSDMKAEGMPSPEELALLELYRGEIPDEVFGEPYLPPLTDGSGRDRKGIIAARNLLDAAGYPLKDGKRMTPEGEVFTVEFLDRESSFDRVVQPFIRRLERLGIEGKSVLVDPAQFQKRVSEFDFDLMARRFSMTPVLGEALMRYWSSAEADVQGSNNLSGIRSPAIDALTKTVIDAETRAEQVIAARALDRVLRAGRYWIPHWYKGAHNIAYWDEFGFPAEKPRYALAVDQTWWHDREKAERIGADG